MKKTIIPENFPFISETESYAFFARISEFEHMDNVCLLDENHNVVKELCSDDFYICRHCKGTELDFPNDYIVQYLYYKTDKPVTISYERHKPTPKELNDIERYRIEMGINQQNSRKAKGI